MRRRARALAVVLLTGAGLVSIDCGSSGRTVSGTAIPGTRDARVESGIVRMSALPTYSSLSARSSEPEEERDAPYHASAPDFTVPAAVRSASGQGPRAQMLEASAPSTGTAAASTTATSAVATFNALSSPAPATGFAAMKMANNYPPDTNGAVGPSYVMSTTNDQIVIQDRLGNVLTNTGLSTFWSASWTDIAPAWDPNVRYDPYADRYIFVCMANYGNAGSSLLVAVSATGDPTGAWYQRRVYSDSSTTTIDHPRVGFNGKWIVATGNELSNSTSSFLYAVVYAFDKADLYANGAQVPVKFGNIANAHTMTPALTYDPTVDTMYLVSNYNGYDTSTSPAMGYLGLSTMTGPVGSEILTVNVAYPGTTNVWASKLPTPPNLAPQLGTTAKIGVFDARMNTLVYRNGSLWATHTVFVPADSPTLSAVDWWQIATDGSVQQFGRIQDLGGTYFYDYPSLAVNAQGDMLVGYSRMAAAQYASAAYAFRAAADPAGTVRQEFVAQAGKGSYALYDGSGANRWGDYSVTQVDPANDTDFWTMQEYAESTTTAGQWGTWWVNVAAPPVPASILQSISVSPSTVTGGQGATGVVTLSSAAPAGGLAVALSSSTAAAQVPPTVAVPEGSTSASFAITTTPVTTSTLATISATYAGVTQGTPLSVAGSAGYALSVSAQANRSGAVPLNGATVSGNSFVFTSYAGDPQNSLPAGITKVCYWLDNPTMGGTATHCESAVPYDFAGSSSSSATSLGNPWDTTALASGSHTITQLVSQTSGATETDTATFVIDNLVVLQSVAVSPATLTSGQSGTGTIALSGAAPSTGVQVRLSSNNAAAQVPSSVLVPASATSAAFGVSTTTVNASTTATIAAVLGVALQTAAVTVNPATSFAISVSPAIVDAGQSSTGTVTLSGPAPSGGASVSLFASDVAAQVPAIVTVPAGSSNATFAITTSSVAVSTQVTISATYGGATQATTLTVNPPAALQSVAVSPSAVLAGQSATGTVTLNGVAPSTGAPVSLFSSNAAVLVPATVTVAANTSSATFGITTGAVSASTPVTISATYGGATLTATLTVNPPAALQSISVSPSVVAGGQSATGTVTLSSPASSSAVVALSSDNPAAQVPASVTVAGGAASATFAITTSAVGTPTSATISASYGGLTQSTTLTVSAASTASLSVVQARQNFGTATATNVGVNVTTTAGNLLVAFVREGSNATDGFTVTDSQGQVWRLAGYNSFSSSERCGVYYVPGSAAVSSVTANFTTAGGVVRPGIVVYEIAGADASSPLDVGTVGTSLSQAGTAITSAALTTSSANDIVLFAVDVSANQSGTNNGFTPGAGFAFPAAGSATDVRQAVSYAILSSIQGGLTTSMSWPTGALAASQFVAFKAATVNAGPPVLQSVSVSPSMVVGGQSATGTVTLSSPAPSGGATVSLSSSSSAAQVPASVTVAAGTTGASFGVTTSAVGTSTSATVSASYGGVTQSVTITVAAAGTGPGVLQARQAFSGNNKQSSLSLSIATTAGNLLVAFVREGTNATDSFTVTDSQGQAWSFAGYASFSSSERCGIYYMPNSAAVSSVTASFTTVGGVVRPGIVVYEIAGADASSPLDVGAIGSSLSQAGTAITSAALSTSHANDILLFAVDVSANQSGFTPGTGFAFPAGGSATNARQAVAYQIVSSPQSNLTTSMRWPASALAASQFVAFH